LPFIFLHKKKESKTFIEKKNNLFYLKNGQWEEVEILAWHREVFRRK